MSKSIKASKPIQTTTASIGGFFIHYMLLNNANRVVYKSEVIPKLLAFILFSYFLAEEAPLMLLCVGQLAPADGSQHLHHHPGC